MNAEQAARAIGCSSKTVLRHIAKGTISATHKHAQELDIAEDQVEKLKQVLDSAKSRQSTDMLQELELLTLRVQTLEEKVQTLESAQTLSLVPTMSSAVPTTKDTHQPQQGPRNRNVGAKKGTLPDGCILCSDFAKQHGIPRETMRDYLLLGIGPGSVPGELADPMIPVKEQIDYSERPKPGRPKETERYFTPEQQKNTIEVLKRHGKIQ